MLRLAISISLALAATITQAARMTAEAFESYTTGKTLYFSESGETYGAERYLPNRRVEWSFLDGKCKTGEWYPDDGAICFVYEDRPDPQCWEFEASAAGLRATFLGSGETTELYEANKTEEPMYCMGPDVGV